MAFKHLSLLPLALLCSKGIADDDVVIRIANPSEFTAFVNNANSRRSTFRATTVYLDSDLSLSGEILEPIGNDSVYYYFGGVFDGQGHIISDLKMNTSSSEYAGLFGYSTGLTIRNVVLDSSCSITSSYSGSFDVGVGGIIGHCHSSSKQCNIENNVNMADVTFSGEVPEGKDLYFGGIAGYLQAHKPIYVKNCVNYGSVTHSGTIELSFIGGIVGHIFGSTSYIYNSLNYGTITYSGILSPRMYLGGIAGHVDDTTYIGNCVSAGKINSTKQDYVGAILGGVNSVYVYVSYCYYTSDTKVGKRFGKLISDPQIIETPDSPTTVDSDLVSKLNSNATSCNWNAWLLSTNNGFPTFKASGNAGLTLSSKLIVTPTLSSDWRTFKWCTDEAMTTELTESSVSENITLYGRWDMYAVTFNATGGKVSDSAKNVTFGSEYGDLPVPKKTGYTFDGWFTEIKGGEKVESTTTLSVPSDRTLYAHWSEEEGSSSEGYVGVLYPLIQLLSILI